MLLLAKLFDIAKIIADKIFRKNANELNDFLFYLWLIL